MKDNLLDNLLQQSAAAEVKEAPVESWPVIAAALHKKKRRRVFWLFFLSVLVLTSGIGLFYANGKKENKLFNYAQRNTITSSQDKTTVQDKVVSPQFIDTNDQNSKTVITTTTQSTNTDNFNIIMSQSSESKKEKTNLYSETRKFDQYQYRKTNGIENKIPKERNLSEKEGKHFLIDDYESNEVATKKKDGQIKGLSALVIANYEELSLPQTKLDDITAIKLMQTNLPNSQPKKETVKPQWKLFYVVTGGTTSANLLKKETPPPTNNFFIGPTGLGQNIIAAAAPQYENGLFLSGAVLFKKSSTDKKIQPQFGVTVQYNRFNAKVYSATPATVLDNIGILTVDSTAIGNSLFSNKSTNGNTAMIRIKNYNIQVGFIAGAAMDLLKINKNQSISLQVQLVPTFNLSQSINWFDVSTERYFTNKKLNAHFNVMPSTSVLWQINKKGSRILLGPSFNFNLFKSNKLVTNLSNTYISNFGLQLQMNIK
jgi:hypothetical protein